MQFHLERLGSRMQCSVSLVLLLAFAGSCCGQLDGIPHFDLVRGLRERGYHDLALAYLEQLQAKANTLNSGIQQSLPLELARSRSDVAALLPAGSERDRLLQKSRGEIDAYVRANPNGELVGEGEQALANTIAEQARSLAMASERAGIHRTNPAPAALELQKNALARFDEADRGFASLQKKLEDQLGIKPNAPPSKNTNQPPPRGSPLYLSTLYYRALTRYDKSRIGGLGIRDAGIANDEARQIAEKLSLFRSVSAVGWQGYALLARTLEGADDTKANQIYRTIDNANTPNAQVAQRAMRYFPLARADAAGELTEKSPERERIKSQAERWLQLYSTTAGNQQDAQHVRYILIRILAKELEETPDNRRQAQESQLKLDRVLVLIDNMDNGRAENQEALERLKYSMLRLSGRAKGPLEALKSFDEVLLRASLEFNSQQALEAKLKEVGDTAARKDVEAQFNQQVATTLAALRRAQSLMSESVVSERNRVRVLNMLQSCLRRSNDGPRAALLCEHLAITSRQPEVAQSAAAEALRLYQFLSREGGKPDATASARLFAMAELLETRFPDSPATDEARSILGRDLLSKKQYDAAIAMLTKVKTNPGTARYLAGLTSWTKHREANPKNLKTPSPDLNRAVQLLGEAQAAFAQQQNKENLEERTEVQTTLLLLGIYDTLGDADKVLATAQPLLKRIEANKLPTGLANGIELQVLDAAMGAYLQKKDYQQGPAQLLTILAKRRDDPKLGDPTKLLQSTAQRIRLQLDAYQKQGEAAKPQYQSTRESFKLLLQQLEKDPKLPLKQRVWLANSYTCIGDPAHAARLLAGITPPPAGKTGTEPDDATLLYRQAVCLRIEAMRQAAMSEADANDRDKALAVVSKEMQTLMAEPWAKRNPVLLRDEIYLLQLRGNYSGKAGAIARWDQLRTVLLPHIEKNDNLKELYWESMYNLAYCIYQEALMLKNQESKAKSIHRAAALIDEARRANYGTPTQAARYKELLGNPKYADLKTAAERMDTNPKR